MSIEILDDGSLKKIYVIGHSHHDYAWERERQWHILRYCRLFSEMLDWLKTNPEATWLIDNAAHSLIPFFENFPERTKEFKDYVKAGRIEVSNGGYSLARPSCVGEETFIRNLLAGDEYFKKTLGIETGDIPLYYNVDTASGQRQMPQILKLAGFKYYRFQRPEISLDQRKIPRAFWWKGLDGSEILVSRGAGVGFFNVQYSNMDFKSEWDEIRRAFFNEEIAPRRPDGLCPHDTELIPYGCDDSRPPLNWYDKEIRLNDFIKEWNKKEKAALKFGTAKEYFEELAAKKLPVFDGGLDDAELSFNLPAKGDASMWRMRGELDKLIVRLENVCAICTLMGEEYPEDEISEIWMQLFEITGHAIDWVLREDDAQLMTIAQNAKTKAEIMLDKYLTKLAGMIEYTGGELAVAVNTQSRERLENVRICVTSPLGVKEFTLHDAYGNNLEYQIVERNSFFSIPKEYRRHDYVSVDVLTQVNTPAFGYNAITVKYTDSLINEDSGQIKLASLNERELPTAPDEIEIDAGSLAVTLSRGRITKIVNKQSGRIMQADADGSLYYLRCVTTGPYKTWMYENEVTGEILFAPSDFKFIENGPLRWRYRVFGAFTDGQTAKLDIVINRGSSAVEFELELDTKPMNCYYTVDFSCDGGTKSYADVYFGVEPRNTDEIIYNYGEAYIKGQIYGRNFVSFEKDSQPLALVSGNCSVYYIHDSKNRRMSMFLTRNCIYSDSQEDWVRKMPGSFALDGKNHFRFALMAAEKYGSFGDIQQYVKSYHHPLLLGKKYNQNKNGTPPIASFIKNPSADVVQSAVYRKNGRMYIRLFETNGNETQLSLELPNAVKSVNNVDFLGRSLGDEFKFDAKNHTLTGTVGAFEIVTLEIEI